MQGVTAARRRTLSAPPLRRWGPREAALGSWLTKRMGLPARKALMVLGAMTGVQITADGLVQATRQPGTATMSRARARWAALRKCDPSEKLLLSGRACATGTVGAGQADEPNRHPGRVPAVGSGLVTVDGRPSRQHPRGMPLKAHTQGPEIAGGGRRRGPLGEPGPDRRGVRVAEGRTRGT